VAFKTLGKERKAADGRSFIALRDGHGDFPVSAEFTTPSLPLPCQTARNSCICLRLLCISALLRYCPENCNQVLRIYFRTEFTWIMMQVKKHPRQVPSCLIPGDNYTADLLTAAGTAPAAQLLDPHLFISSQAETMRLLEQAGEELFFETFGVILSGSELRFFA
jgi:hypothetical protein